MQQNDYGMRAFKTDSKIGLTLSGGGFRASIFHLGVIRRLEELGLMKNISVISAVSGGSIIAAYYVIEMERRLRENLSDLADNKKDIDQIRLEIFEQIAEDFFKALDHNLRCRALIFSPFYHPLRWLKSLWPVCSRSDLMQAEYDKWFYRNNSIDQLPSVTQRKINDTSFVFGPKLILNTTSLLDGSKVPFSRVPVSRFSEFGKVNKNTYKLSRIVGASSCVPGLFPPVPVKGDKLVDGGVSDNQGVEIMLEEQPDIILVSDASGQMEVIHSIKDHVVAVISRTMSILQFQVREKIINILKGWREVDKNAREFAFAHLFLNLKDRSNTPRVSSEFIQALGRIRTDLDQFSLIERESLMYHGYTLMNAQIIKHCTKLKEYISKETDLQQTTCPPLFLYEKKHPQKSALHRRERIKKVLVIGKQKLFTLRSLKKYPWKIGPIVFFVWFLPLLYLYLSGMGHIDWLQDHIGEPFLDYLKGFCPQWIRLIITKILGLEDWSMFTRVATIALCLGLAIYLLSFVMYLLIRKVVSALDAKEYERLSGGTPFTLHWQIFSGYNKDSQEDQKE